MTEKIVKEVEVKPVAKLEEEGDIAADYLEGLLDIADLDGDNPESGAEETGEVKGQRKQPRKKKKR